MTEGDETMKTVRAIDAEVPIHTVTITVCGLCLSGYGLECHTPGCLYWMASVPRVEGHTLLQRMAGVGSVDGRQVPLDGRMPEEMGWP